VHSPRRVERPVIAAEEVHKRFGRHQVLRGVNFAARGGQVVAILGENGSGKSTLLRILAGLDRADRGRIDRRVPLGYCPQEAVLYPYLTPDEHFELFGCAHGLSRGDARARAGALLDRFAFARYRDRVVVELSGGTRQKLNLALALLHDPPLLLLDEPYAGFDVETYRHFLEYLSEAQRAGKCVVLVSHLVFERDRFDAVFDLCDGRLDGRAG
jgi:ABC-2 type transport system ATP-binding protein